MAQREIKKPLLDTSTALAFANGNNAGKQLKKIAKDEPADKQARAFFAPEGDKRLTINIKDELHRKLKIAAIERDSTAGEIIEKLIENYL
jgi:hypothetical protein